MTWYFPLDRKAWVEAGIDLGMKCYMDCFMGE